MNIFYPLLCYYPSQAGGPASTIYWLNKSMGLSGHNANVISTKYGLIEDNVDHRLIYKPYNIDVNFVSGSFLSFFRPKYLSKLLRGDIVHFSSIFFAPTFLLMSLGILFRRKILLSPRGELYESALLRKSFFKSNYLKLIGLFQTKINFHATNVYERELISVRFPYAKSITVLPNYIDIPKKIKTQKRKQILFLGRINPIKNIDMLLSSYSKLPDKIKSEFSLIIAGEAKLEYEKRYLKEMTLLAQKLNLRNNITFINGVYGQDKEKLIAESYCTVLPSKSENFGNVILESLCQDTPVIVSKNAPWSILETSVAGYWIDANESSLKDALLKMVTQNELEYKRMQNVASKLVSEEFDIKKNIYKWEHLYKTL